MIETRNNEVIKKLVNRSFKKNTLRNICAILGIILTSILISASFSAALSLKKTNDYYVQMLNNGSDIQLKGSINLVEKLAEIEDINKIGIWGECSDDILKNPEFVGKNFKLMYSNSMGYELNEITLIEGDYPSNSNEVLLSDIVANALDSKPKVGEEVELYLDVLNKNNEYEVKPITFKVSGIYKSIWYEGSAPIPAFVSMDFVEKYNSHMLDKTLYMITHDKVTKRSSYNDVKIIADEIATEIGIDSIAPGPYYVHKANKMYELPVVAAVMMGIGLIMFIGYLLISNIFYISIVQDIKYYGLLKTIGTTSKQIKKIIIRQGNKLCFIGIPIGIVIGYILGIKLLPFALERTNAAPYVQIFKNPIVFVFAIIFSYITVYISCMRPCKVACSVSPIEAVRYIGVDSNQGKKSVKRTSKGKKLNKMAIYNVLRNKKKMIMTVLSIGIGIAIFVITFTFANGVDPILRADNDMYYDLEINHKEIGGMETLRGENRSTFLAITENQNKEAFEPISMEMYEEIKALPNVEMVNKYYMARNNYKMEEESRIYKNSFLGEVKNQGLIKKEFDSYINDGFPYGDKFYSENGNIKLEIIGVEEDALRNATKSDIRIDSSNWDFGKFKNGESMIFTRGINGIYTFGDVKLYGDDVIKKGDTLTLDFYRYDSNDYEEKTFEVMDVVQNDYESWNTQYYRDFSYEPIIMSTEAFEEIYPNYKECIYKIGINIKGDLEETTEEIMNIVRKYGNFQVYTQSKQAIIENGEADKATVLLIGMCISFVVAFIGIINVINTVFTNILSRRKEFAVLESIGMTKKQLKKLLILEGMYYSVFSFIVMTTVSVIGTISMSSLEFFDRLSVLHLVMAITAGSVAMVIVIVGISLIGYKNFCKGNLVEMIKGEE